MSDGGAGKRVGFLIAGVQKGGTTALYDHLAELPGLCLPAVKEAHFFDNEERVDWSAPDYAPLHAHFADVQALWGDATPITLYWPNALERVRAYNPAMRIIVLLRDPVERAWSHWQMEYARGKETQPFAWCIREGRARMAEHTPVPGFHRVFSYVERGYYGRQLARLFSLFPREQVLVLASEALRRKPDATIRTVCRFLDLAEPEAAIAPRVSRPAAAISYPSRLESSDVAFLQRQFGEETERLHALLPDFVYE